MNMFQKYGLQMMAFASMFGGNRRSKNIKTIERKSKYQFKQVGGMNKNQRQKRKRLASNPHLRKSL